MPDSITFDPVDILRPPAMVSNRLPDLTIVYERLFRAFRGKLFHDTRRNIGVVGVGHKVIQHDDLLNMWPDAHVLFGIVEIHPLRGFSIIMIEGSFLSSIVDDLFSASEIAPPTAGPDLTPMERRIGESIMRMVAQSAHDALRTHLEVNVHVLRTETHPTLASVADAAEPYYAMFAKLEAAGGGGGVTVAFPYRSLEAFRTALSSPGGASLRHDSDATWDRQFSAALDEIEISLGIEIGTASIPLRDLASLAPGDVLPISLHRLARVTDVNGPVAEAVFGRLDEERYGVIFQNAK